MRPGLKEQLDLALRRAAKKGPRPWPQLKAELVADGLAQETLEDNHVAVADMFLLCLAASQGQPPTPSRIRPSSSNLIRTSSPSASSSVDPDLSQEPSPFKPNSRFAQPQAITSLEQEPEEGWIDLSAGKGSRHKAYVSFYFGPKPGNVIGQHIIDQYDKQLLPHFQDDEITLPCCIDSQPARTYVVKFRVEQSEVFDICLGACWNKPEQSRRDPSRTRKTKMEGPSQRGPSGSNLPIAVTHGGASNSTPPPQPYTPEFLASFSAKFLLETQAFSSLQPPITLVAKPPRRSRKPKDKHAASDTDLEPTAPNRQTRARVRPLTLEASYDDNPRSIMDGQTKPSGSGRTASPIRKHLGRKSDASCTSDEAAKLFDTDASEESNSTSPDRGPPVVDGPKLSPSDAFFLARLQRM